MENDSFMKNKLKLMCIPVLLAFYILDANAQVSSFARKELPLIEAGVGAIFVNVPDYPGSNRNQSFSIPFPTLIYRGRILRADEDGGLRTRFAKSNRFEINLSVGGSLPANSEDNSTRSGMPDLDTVGEIGPGLIIHLIPKSVQSKQKLGLNIPLRFAVSSDFKDTRGRGLVFNPLLYYINDGLIHSRFIFFSSISARWAQRKYHQMFYQVDQKYQIPNIRPAYNASSGLVSYDLSIGTTFRLNKSTSIFGGIQYANYSDAANTDSPLFVQNYSLSTALGIVWWGYQSEQKGAFQ